MPSSLAVEISELEAFPLERLPEEQRRVVRDKLEALKRVLAANPLQLAEPYPKQRLFLASRDQLKGFFGGNGAGKTWIGTLDDVIQLVDRDAVPKHLRAFKHWEPPFFLRVVAPKQKLLDTKTIPEFRALLPASQLRGGSFDKAYKGSEGKLYLANGSWVLFNTSDQDRDAHASVELHRCRFDEEPEGEHGKGIYTENVARLRKFLPHAQISFTMTPLFGMSWTFDEVYERRGEPGVHVTVASMRDNPHVNSAATIKALGHLSEAERRAVVDGEFVHFHGAVIDLRDEHVVPPPDRLHVRGLDVYVGIDPGIARGGVVWCGFDRDNVLLVFDELYPEGLTVEQITKLIREKNARWGIDPRFFVIDPSARNRSLTNAQSVEAEFQRNGIFPIHGQNDRAAGILQLRGRLEHGGLLVAENCKAVRYEAKRWLVAKDEKSSEESASGDQFVTKGPDHCLVPGTLVETEGGPLEIERVSVGDLVWTRAGLRRVEAAGITNLDAEVVALDLEDGRSVSGTGNHPVFVEGRGWTNMDSVGSGLCVVASGSIGAGGPRLGRVRALGVRSAGRSVVYNLTVEGQSEFFANGVLVHNCWDPIRYCAMERLWFEPTRRKRVTRARHPDEMPAWNGVPQSDGVDVPPSGVWS